MGGPEGGPGPPPPSPPPPLPLLRFSLLPAPTSSPLGLPETFPAFTDACPVPFLFGSFRAPFSPSSVVPL